MRSADKRRGRRQAISAAVQALEPRVLLSTINGNGPDDPDGSPAPTGLSPVITQSPVGASGTLPLSSVPQLHSDPGAKDQIYLDFIGAPAQTWGGYSVPATPAFDQDGDPTTFSSGELTAIQQIWAVVAEAYSPFNIDVTTVAPSSLVHKQNLEVVVGGNGAWTGGNYGGLSYTGAFANTFEPNISWVFSQNLANGPFYCGEASSHEAGHEFGLNHQSTWSGTTLTAEYNPGNSLVAPIMGDSYYAQRGLWWDGTSDVSSTTIQDDMAVISSATNGFGYRTQDHGQSIATANALTITGGSVSGSGIIEKTTDTDFFSFTTAAGSVTLNLNTITFGATLHGKLQLFSSNGTLLATAADPNNLGQTITTTLAAGTYYLSVDSYGQYGDVGEYTISGTVATAQATPTFTISGPSSINEGASYALNLAATDPGQTVSSWVINWGDGNLQTVTGNPSSVSHVYSVGPSSYTISATATDGTGTYNASGTQAVSVLHVAPNATISGGSSVNELVAYTLNLSVLDPNHTILSWAINWGDGSAVQTVSGNPPSVTHTFASGPHGYTISATVADDVGTYSASDTQAVSILHVPPVVSIAGPGSVNEQSSYTLSLSASDPGHSILSWAINWGDGSAVQVVSGNPSSVTHSFATGPNSYTISATVTDDVGTYSASDTQAVSILHVPPTLGISGPATVTAGTMYTLNLSSSDPGHTISSWAINWGDGSAVQNLSGNPSSVTHVYASGPASCTISATATDEVSTYSAAATVAVSVQPVTPVFKISGPAIVNEQSPYTLNLSTTDPGQTVSSWVINWGDGNLQTVNGNPSSVSHVYSVGPNSYTISATATDGTGTYNASGTQAVSVLHVAPNATISGASSVNELVAYTLNLSVLDPNHTIVSWAINWGDGSAIQTVSGNPPSVTHTFAKGFNSYTISATVIDDVGTYSAAATQAVSVLHVAPMVSIAGPGIVNEQSTYTLSLSASDPGHSIVSWAINWGDGSPIQTVSGSPPSVTHTFASGPHSYTISATVTDDVGTYAAANTLAVSVLHAPPAASIGGASSVNERATYTLSLSISDPGHTIVSWSINWGDGSAVQPVSGNPSSVTHSFAAGPNSYTISATVTDDVATYSTSDTQTVSVLHVPPTLGISGPATVTAGALYTLNLSGSDPGHTISSWAINWGDGSAVQNLNGNPSSVTHVYAFGPASCTISATTTDNVGTYSAASTVAVSVQAVSSTPVFTISGPLTINEQSTYTLTLSGSDAGHTVSSWSINWGDGSAVQLVSGNPSSATHVFALGPNSYSITATATDDTGSYPANNSQNVSVLHVPPAVTISGPGSVTLPAAYTLNLSATDPGHAISSWTINWGDGSTQVLGNVASSSHVFASAGNYQITASVSDNVGTYPANSVNVQVNPAPDSTPPMALASLGSVPSNNSFTVTYSDNVAINLATLGNNNILITGPNGFSQLAALAGTSVTTNAPSITAAYLVTPPGGAWTYTADGTYTVSMVANSVTDTSGNAVAAGTLGTFTINITPPSIPSKGHHTKSGTIVAKGAATYVSFTLAAPAMTTLQLSTSQPGITLELLDSNLNTMAAKSGKKSVSFAQPLKAGTYYVRVTCSAAKPTTYQVGLTTKALTVAQRARFTQLS